MQFANSYSFYSQLDDDDDHGDEGNDDNSEKDDDGDDDDDDDDANEFFYLSSNFSPFTHTQLKKTTAQFQFPLFFPDFIETAS